MPAAQQKRAVIIPGNGCDEGPDGLDDCMWYPWMADRLRSLGYEIVLSGFPEPIRATESIWKGFVQQLLSQCGDGSPLGKDTLIVGHSSGAACALRLMEEHPVGACLLVSAYDSDMGDDLERESGYFNRPFDFEAMRKNTSDPNSENGAPKIVQFHSKNDHLVPVEVARSLNAKLQCPYVEMPSDGHFQDDDYEVFFDAMLEHGLLWK
jgi:predicted alpha/beta hydrolase family esterase